MKRMVEIIGTWVLSAIDNAAPSSMTETIKATGSNIFTYTMSIDVERMQYGISERI